MTQVSINHLRLDGGTQPRAQLDFVTIGEYADAMKAGAQFPPVEAVYDGTDHWLWDGFHRVEAARLNGGELAAVEVSVRQGTRRDAVLLSTEANATHGLRRTNADKRRAALVLLRDEEWSQWSDREIARKCAVSNAFVSQLRAEVAPAIVEAEEGDVVVPSAAMTTAQPSPVSPSMTSASSVEPSSKPAAPNKAPAQATPRKSTEAARKSEKAASRERIVKRGGKTIKMKTANIGKSKKPAKKTPAGTTSKTLNKAQIAGKVVKVERVAIAPVTASAVCPACSVEPSHYSRVGAVWSCGDCGALVILVVSPAGSVACPSCGKPVSQGAAFCGHCGEVIR